MHAVRCAVRFTRLAHKEAGRSRRAARGQRANSNMLSFPDREQLQMDTSEDKSRPCNTKLNVTVRATLVLCTSGAIYARWRSPLDFYFPRQNDINRVRECFLLILRVIGLQTLDYPGCAPVCRSSFLLPFMLDAVSTRPSK